MRVWRGRIVWEGWGRGEGEKTDCTHMDRRGFGNMVMYYFLPRWYSSLPKHTRASHCRYYLASVLRYMVDMYTGESSRLITFSSRTVTHS